MEDRTQLAVRIRGNLRSLARDGAVPAHLPAEAGADAATHLHELAEAAELLADLPLERAPTAVLAPVDEALTGVSDGLDACRRLNERAAGPDADDLRRAAQGLASRVRDLHLRLAALLGVLAHVAGDLPASRRRAEASLARAESLVAAGAANLDEMLRRARAAAPDDGAAARADIQARRGARWLIAAAGLGGATVAGAWLLAALGPPVESWSDPRAAYHAAARGLTTAVGLLAALWCLRMHGACARAAAAGRGRATAREVGEPVRTGPGGSGASPQRNELG